MTEDLPRTGIYMVRPTLDDLPEAPLPAPFTLRDYRPGDEATWVRIHELADRYNAITPALYREQFGTDEGELCKRQLYLCADSGDAIGTVHVVDGNHRDHEIAEQRMCGRGFGFRFLRGSRRGGVGNAGQLPGQHQQRLLAADLAAVYGQRNAVVGPDRAKVLADFDQLDMHP